MTTSVYDTARANAGHLLYGRSRGAAARAFRTGYHYSDDRSLSPPEGTSAHEYWRAGRDHARRDRLSRRVARLFRRTLAPVVELDDPYPSLWANANRLLGHPGGCTCSTCELAARLGSTIRNREIAP